MNNSELKKGNLKLIFKKMNKVLNFIATEIAKDTGWQQIENPSTTKYETYEISVRVVGKEISLAGAIKAKSNFTFPAYSVIGTLPVGRRPDKKTFVVACCSNNAVPVQMIIQTNGDVLLYTIGGSSGGGTTYTFSGQFLGGA